MQTHKWNHQSVKFDQRCVYGQASKFTKRNLWLEWPSQVASVYFINMITILAYIHWRAPQAFQLWSTTATTTIPAAAVAAATAATTKPSLAHHVSILLRDFWPRCASTTINLLNILTHAYMDACVRIHIRSDFLLRCLTVSQFRVAPNSKTYKNRG